MNIIVKFWD